MKARSVLALALALAVALLSPAVGASATPALESRDGDNTIYFRWDQDTRRVVAAESSRMIVADAPVEILTGLRDGARKIAMRAVIRNVSEDSVMRVDGRLVHKVWDDSGELIRRLRSRALDLVLSPGEQIRTRFSYLLPSGRYSARTDFVAR
ncbi:MAG TPA: hypothetical protein VG408_06210 [Actinomycetota bacterium]|nr:hypothetical protein [Actinomycetota bacterium]